MTGCLGQQDLRKWAQPLNKQLGDEPSKVRMKRKHDPEVWSNVHMQSTKKMRILVFTWMKHN